MNRKYHWDVQDVVVTSVSKGDYKGHPFRGNQWTKVGRVSDNSSVPIIQDVMSENKNRDYPVNDIIEQHLSQVGLDDKALKAKVAENILADMKAAGVTDKDIENLYLELEKKGEILYRGEVVDSTIHPSTNFKESGSFASEFHNPQFRQNLQEFLQDHPLDMQGVEAYLPTIPGTNLVQSKIVSFSTKDVKIEYDSVKQEARILAKTTIDGKEVVVGVPFHELDFQIGRFSKAGNSGRGTQFSPEQYRKLLYEKTGLAVEFYGGNFHIEVAPKKFSFSANEKKITTKKVEPIKVVEGIIQSWAVSSGSFGSLLVGDSIARTMGGVSWKPETQKGGPKVGDTVYEKKRMETIEGLSSGSKKVVDAFTKASYDRTQKTLKELGIKEVVVSRGLMHDRNSVLGKPNSSKVETFQDVPIAGRPLQSYAQRASIAYEFAQGAGANQIVLVRIPASRIFSTPSTGLGCRNENEMVVIAKKGDKATVLEWNGAEVAMWGSERHKPIDEALNAVNFDELVALAKKQLVLELDSDLRNSDWTKRTFDIPDAKTTDDYLKVFGITTAQQAKEHIDAHRNLPYWASVPKKIKSDIALIAMQADAPKGMQVPKTNE